MLKGQIRRNVEGALAELKLRYPRSRIEYVAYDRGLIVRGLSPEPGALLPEVSLRNTFHVRVRIDGRLREIEAWEDPVTNEIELTSERDAE